MYKIGSVITYTDFCGGIRRVLVETKESNIKNGRPGFSGMITEGPEAGRRCWGYDQITKIHFY